MPLTWQDMKEMRDRMLKPQYLEAGIGRYSFLCQIPLHSGAHAVATTHNRPTVRLLGASCQTIGFQSFANFMEKKIEHMFADAINPVLDKLKDLKAPEKTPIWFLLVPGTWA